MVIEFTPEGEDELYEPVPELVHENSILIFDPAEFVEKFNCDAVWATPEGVFVLDRDSRKWVNVEGGNPAPKLKRVQ